MFCLKQNAYWHLFYCKHLALCRARYCSRLVYPFWLSWLPGIGTVRTVTKLHGLLDDSTKANSSSVTVRARRQNELEATYLGFFDLSISNLASQLHPFVWSSAILKFQRNFSVQSFWLWLALVVMQFNWEGATNYCSELIDGLSWISFLAIVEC